MGKLSLQFHATVNDIYEFVNSLSKSENYNACGVIFAPSFKVEKISIVSSINDFKRYDMIVVSKERIICDDNYKQFICKQDNNLVITVGYNGNDILKESTMWINAEKDIDKDWKRIINMYKKSLLKGAWVVNPNTNEKAYYKNHKYTINAKLAYESGVKLCPITGWNIYELTNEQNKE